VNSDQHRSLVYRETAVSVGINMALSGLFFLLIFGVADRIFVRDLVIDFLPQGLAIGFMATLIPGLIVHRRLGHGALRSVGLRLFVRALLSALVAALLLGGAAALLLAMLTGETIAFLPALAIKLLFGAIAALLVTPGAVRAALRRPVGALDA